MPPAFNLSQDQTLQFDTVCAIVLSTIDYSLAGIEVFDVSIDFPLSIA
jgi:hypothetical protein